MAGINPATGRFDPYYNGGGSAPASSNTPSGFTISAPVPTQTGGSLSGVQLNPATGYTTPMPSSPVQPPPPPPPPPSPAKTVVNIGTRRGFGGLVETVQYWSDGSVTVIDSYKDMSAKDSVLAMFTAAGLDSSFAAQLMASIDAVYATNVMPTDSQILNSIYSSDAYKTRFSGNEVIRKRMADGSARPGDRMLSPKEYMDVEASYRQILQDAGMPTGFYDQTSDFNTLIGNSVSVAEFKGRVDTAFDVLNNADAATKDALSSFYGLSDGDLVAYLLDPAKAQPILMGKSQNAFGLNDANALSRAYGAARIGGDQERMGLTADKSLSEEILASGQQGASKAAFGAAARQQDDVSRLGSLYGESLDFRDVVKESLNLEGGATSGKKRRKFASKERAAFSTKSAIGKTSLSSARDV